MTLDYDPTEVILSAAECEIARMLGKARNAKARRNNIPDQIVDENNSSVAIDILGMAGELAVAKYLNACPDLSTDHIPSYDLEWEGYKIQVKTTELSYGQLLVGEIKSKIEPDHLYVLVIGTMPKFTIKGYLMGRFIKLVGEERVNKRGKPYWLVKQRNLLPLPNHL